MAENFIDASRSAVALGLSGTCRSWDRKGQW